jgi:hypothetical protein
MFVAFRTFLLVALASLIAGCGGSTAAPASSSAPITAPSITADPVTLVLSAGDVGNGYLTVASQTGTDTLKRTMFDDPASIRRVERSAWLSGYHALYTDTQSTGVLTDASVFRTDAVAVRVAASWRQSGARSLHGRPITAPSGSLDHVSLIAGSISADGRRLKAYAILWVHGNVVASIILFGRDATPARVAGLATAQDGRISNSA